MALTQDRNLHPHKWKSSQPTEKDGTGRITKRSFYPEEDFDGDPVFEWNYTYIPDYSDEEPGISVKDLKPNS